AVGRRLGRVVAVRQAARDGRLPAVVERDRAGVVGLADAAHAVRPAVAGSAAAAARAGAATAVDPELPAVLHAVRAALGAARVEGAKVRGAVHVDGARRAVGRGRLADAADAALRRAVGVLAAVAD